MKKVKIFLGIIAVFVVSIFFATQNVGSGQVSKDIEFLMLIFNGFFSLLSIGVGTIIILLYVK